MAPGLPIEKRKSGPYLSRWVRDGSADRAGLQEEQPGGAKLTMSKCNKYEFVTFQPSSWHYLLLFSVKFCFVDNVRYIQRDRFIPKLGRWI